MEPPVIKRETAPVIGLDVSRLSFHVIRLAVCALVTLALAGCGVTRPVVKIGVVAPFEGRYRAVGYDVIYAVRLAVRERNVAGGINGYAVEVVSLDDGGDTAAATEQARKLALDPAVVAVIGHWRDDTTLAGAPVYVGAGLPLVAPGVGAPGLSSYSPIAFRLYPTAAAIEEAARHVAASLGLERLAFVRSEADLVQVRGTSPEAVFIGLDPLPAAEAVTGLVRAGVRAKWLGGAALADPQYFAIAGAAAEGSLVILGAPLPGDVAGADGFIARYRAVAGAEPGWRALLAYDATQLLFEAIAQAAAQGAPSRSGVAEALRRSQVQGLIGPISFDAQGNWRQARLVVYQVAGERLRLEGTVGAVSAPQ